VVTNDEQRRAAEVLVWHLQHADMENAIKEHKSGFVLVALADLVEDAGDTQIFVVVGFDGSRTKRRTDRNDLSPRSCH
jgi:hypothetical protein